MDVAQVRGSKVSGDAVVPKRDVLSRVAVYFLVGLLSFFGAVVVLNLWDWSLMRYPFLFERDSVWMAMTTKGLIETGWYLSNPNLGAPGIFQLLDFPVADGFNYILLRVIAFFSSNWALVNNVFYLLTYPLCSMTSLFVLRRLGLRSPLSIVASVLFSLLPYHFLRGEHHLLLSAYFMVPLATWLAVLVYKDEAFQTGMKGWWYAVICFVLGSTGIYYAFFGAFFVLTAGLVSSLCRKRGRPLKHALLFVFLISSAVFVNVWPTLRQGYENGHNRVAIKRHSNESEMYSLKLAQMLLPLENDRLEALAKLTKRYNRSGVTINENRTVTLGLIGSVGFLFLIFSAMAKKRKKDRERGDSTIDALSCLTLGGILLGTTGGLSSLFAHFVTPSIRCYNRISVFLAFFAIAAFFFLFQKILERRPRAMWGFGMIALLFGVWNQTSSDFSLLSHMDEIKEQVRSAKRFVHRVDNALPEGSMIFQLPYIPFPEGGGLREYGDTDHFKAPLFSHRQRWSFGAIKGRKTAAWQQHVSALPLTSMLEQIVYMGFRGLYLNRLAYEDRAEGKADEVSQVVKLMPLESASGDELFWDLQPFAEQLKQAQTAEEWNRNLERTHCELNGFKVRKKR